IGKGKQCERSVRGVGAFIELIPEYFRSKPKIVLTSRQRCSIRKIEIVVRRLILIIYCVSKLEGAQYLDVRQASHLRVADTAYPNLLSRQRARGRASTGDAGVAGAELVDGLRGEDVSMRNGQIPVAEGTKGREPGHSGAGKRHILIRV